MQVLSEDRLKRCQPLFIPRLLVTYIMYLILPRILKLFGKKNPSIHCIKFFVLEPFDYNFKLTGMSFLNSNFKREEIFSTRDLWDEIEERSQAIITRKWKYIRNDMPEIPYDAKQAYLEFYRPALHIMRSLKAKNKLDINQAAFFRNKKLKEELYNLDTDQHELFNLATDPAHKMIIKSLRHKLDLYDSKMQSDVNVFDPVYPIAVDLLKWVKKEKPQQYKLMLEGVEIGFSHLLKEYRNSNH